MSVPLLNSEIFTIPLWDNQYLLYAPLRRVAFAANAKAVNFLVQLQKGQIDEKSDPNGLFLTFLRQLHLIDAPQEQLPVTPNREGQPLPTAITLFLTTACNLRCTYCYASAGETEIKKMSLATAQRGIDYIANNIAKKHFIATNLGQEKIAYLEVIYHGGGEPTANWQVLTDSFTYAQQKAKLLGIQAKGSVASNGVLRSQQIAWIINNFSSISISFGGLPEIHDKHRFMANGQGSSARVMETLHQLDAANFNYLLRVTVTQDQIEYLPDSINFICENFKPKRIQVEPAYAVGRAENIPSAETEQFIQHYRLAQAKAASYGYQIYYAAAQIDKLTDHFCGISQDQFGLSPDGNVSACYANHAEDNAFSHVFFYGKPDTEGKNYIFNLNTLNNLRQQTVQHKAFCQGCFAKWHCAGDCHHNTLVTHGTGEFVGSARCHITRELTKDQLLARIIAQGGIYWYGA